MKQDDRLSGRERQLLDALHRTGAATVKQVAEELSDPPSLTAVRTLLNILVKKGAATKETRGRAKVYRAAAPRDEAGKQALHSVLRTFYGGSLVEAVAAHFSDPRGARGLSEADLQRLAEAIERAKAKEREA